MPDSEKEKKIIIPTVIGTEKRTPEEIEYYSKIVKEIEEEKEERKAIEEIKKKVERGEYLTLEEAKLLLNAYEKKVIKKTEEEVKDLETDGQKIEKEAKKVDREAVLTTEEKVETQEITDQGEGAKEALIKEIEEIDPKDLPCWVDRTGPENEIQPEEFARRYSKAIEEVKKILDGLKQKEEFKRLTDEELINEIYERIKYQGRYDKVKDDIISNYYRDISRKFESSPDKHLMALEYLLGKIEIQKAKKAEDSLAKEGSYIRNVRIDSDNLIQEWGDLISIYERDPKTGQPRLREAVLRDLVSYGLIRDFVLDDETYKRWENLKKESNKLYFEGKKEEARQKTKEYLKELFKFNKDLERVVEKFYSPERLTDEKDIELWKKVKKATECSFEELLAHYRGNKEYLKKRLEKYGLVDLATSHLPVYTYKYLRFLERVQWLRPEVKKIPIRKKNFVEVPTKKEHGENEKEEKIEEETIQKNFVEVPTKKEHGENEKEEKIEEETIRERINAAKVIAQAKTEGKKPEEIEKILAQIKYAEAKNIENDKELTAVIEKLVENFGKKLSEKEKNELIQKIIDTIGLEKKQIENVLNRLEQRIEQIAQEEVMADKKKKGILSKLATIGKTLAYIGTPIITAILAGPGAAAGAALGVGAVRYIEAHVFQKAQIKEIEKKKKEIEKRILKGEKIKELLSNELINELATTKQEQIDRRDKKFLKAEEELRQCEQAYIKFCKGKKIDKEERKKIHQYQQYLDAREKVKGFYKEQIREYLKTKWPKISEEELEKRVKEALALFEIDEDNHLFGREVQVKNPGLWTKIVNRVEKILGWKWLKGGETLKEKSLTGVIFSVAGHLIRHIPGLDRAFMAYGGMKIGEVLAESLVLRRERYKILQNIFTEHLKTNKEIPDELIERVRVQLFTDKEFREKYPTEYAELWQIIDRAEQTKIKKAEVLKEYIQERNDALEKTYTQKMKIDREAKVIRNAARIGGILLGGFMPEIVREAKKGLDKILKGRKPVVTKPAVTKEVPPPGKEIVGVERPTEIITAGKIDNIWKTTERWLEQTGKLEGLNQAQRDYMIDFYCDRIWERYKAGDIEWIKAFGLDPNKGYDFMIKGMKLNYSLLDKPEFLTKALSLAKGLSPEQMANILRIREMGAKYLDEFITGKLSPEAKKFFLENWGLLRMGPGLREAIRKGGSQLLKKLPSAIVKLIKKDFPNMTLDVE